MVTSFIYGLPTWLLGALILALFNIVALGGLALVARRIPVETRRRQNDAAAAMVSIIGVVYAVMLAFIAVEVWQAFDKAEDTVEREADEVADIWRDVQGFPEPTRTKIREALRGYAEIVVKEEWDLQRKGRSSARAQSALQAASAALLAFEPTTLREQMIFGETLRQMNRLLDERRLRLHIADSGVQPVVWAVVVLGTLLLMFSTYFFGLESFRAHLAMTACVATSIGLLTFLIVALDYPFRGAKSIEPEAFETVLKAMSSR